MAQTRVEQHLDGGSHGRRPWRGALFAVLALLLVALIGLGSRAAAWDVGGPPRIADPSSYSGDLMVIGFALIVVMPWVIPALRRRKRRTADPQRELPPVRTKWWVRPLALLAIPLAVVVALLVIKLLPGAAEPKFKLDTSGKAGPAATSSTSQRPPIHWWGYGLLGLVVLGGFAAAWYLREPRPEPASGDDPDELLAAVDLSLEDIERDPDPRRAVIRAYARMERALGSYGLARRPSETPLEYLARALTSLRVGRRSVERLSTLFERAKFSDHEIDMSMKSDALAALGALRDELAGVPS